MGGLSLPLRIGCSILVAAKSPFRKISHGICKTKRGQKPGPDFSRSRGTPTLKSVCVEVLGNSFELEQWRVLAYLLICMLTLEKKTPVFFYRPIFVTAVMKRGVVAVVPLHRSVLVTTAVGDGEWSSWSNSRCAPS